MIRWISSTSGQYQKRIKLTSSGVLSAVAIVSISSFLLSKERCDSSAGLVAADADTTSTAAGGSVAGSASSHVMLHDIPTRSEQMDRLSENKQFDVLVVGGGSTGTGVALDAATRSLRVALIERGDFGNETSSRSTKLLWAGIRYIATATASLLRFRNVSRPLEALHDFRSEFNMVRNCHKERRILLENNPHLTNWVPIAVPVDQWISWPPPFGHPIFATAPIVLPLVFKFYDGMSGFTCPPSHIMSRKRAERKFPQLASEDAKYYCCFYEGQHNDARTATYIALTAAEKGACVTNYTEMVEVIKDKDTGKAIGVKVRDRLKGGKEFNVYAKAIVFAGGPFTDELRQIEDPSSKPAVAAAAGTHIVLPSYYCPRGVGMLDINTSDGRFLFFLPWQGHTLIGTTDRKGPAVSTPGPPEEEIEWLLAECQKYLGKDVVVRRSDVQSAWQGFRPLASDPNAPPGSPVSRDHIISTNPITGITFVTGGKWTTYREMAQDVLDKVVKDHGLIAGPCQTDKIRLRGGDGYDRNLPIKLVQKLGCSQEVAEHLAHTYGMYAFEVVKMANATTKSWPRYGNLLMDGFPYLESEIEYACKKEMVQTVKDMLTLRIPLAFLNSTAAEKAAPRVADIMAKSLGWSRAEKNRQLEEAMQYLDEFGGPIPKQKQRSIKTVEDLFNAFDTDKSGYIEYEELKECLNYWGAPFKSEEEAQAAFKSMDKKKDNRISLNEFKHWWNDPKNKENRLKLDLSEKYRFSTDKLGKGASSRGAAFG